MDDKKFEEWIENSLETYEKIIPNFISQQKEVIRKRDYIISHNYTIQSLMDKNPEISKLLADY